MWGIYDTRDFVWLGTADRPYEFTSEKVAGVAARITGSSLTKSGWVGRYQPREIRSGVYTHRSPCHHCRTQENGGGAEPLRWS